MKSHLESNLPKPEHFHFRNFFASFPPPTQKKNQINRHELAEHFGVTAPV